MYMNWDISLGGLVSTSLEYAINIEKTKLEMDLPRDPSYEG